VFEFTISQIVAFIVNVTAILAYFDFARSGTKGFLRFVAFWLGFPLTFFLKMVVKPDPDLVLERRMNQKLGPEATDIGVPEYVREQIREARRERLGAGGEPDDDRGRDDAGPAPGPAFRPGTRPRPD
jgi:hypothetical protein